MRIHACLLVLLGFLACAPAQEAQPKGKELAPYYPTPRAIVQKMLEMGKLKAGERMFDVGSGDGRIVIMAAQKFGANAVGVELNEDLVERSRAEIERLGLTGRASIIHGDALAQDYSSADLVTAYLLPGFNAKLRPVLEKQLAKGARVICHDFTMEGWEEEESLEITDTEGRLHTIYLYRR
jgi:protein-L-isoaspartate O-methyltransferase